jgi:hypothetical protein
MIFTNASVQTLQHHALPLALRSRNAAATTTGSRARGLATLLYTHARDAALGDALQCTAMNERHAVLGRWCAQHGYAGAIPAWFVEEALAAFQMAWTDDV